MPAYRFLIHGSDVMAPEGKRGFFATRHTFGADQEDAAKKILARLTNEFTKGPSAHIWKSAPPSMTIEKGWRIGWRELFSAPNNGSAFYDERE